MSAHSHDFANWPFEGPTNLAAIACVHVLNGTEPIRYVGHDDHDAPWLLLCRNVEHAPQEGRVVCLGCMVEKDATIAQLADLPKGWSAERTEPGAAWDRAIEEEIGQDDV